MAIIRRRVPAASTTLAEQVAATVARLRTLPVQKPPGIAEAIDWVSVARRSSGSTTSTRLSPSRPSARC